MKSNHFLLILFLGSVIFCSCASQESRYLARQERVLEKLKKAQAQEEERIKKNSTPVAASPKLPPTKDVNKVAPKILYDK